ncbi:NAD(P)/FAD-dependent oxidoreductase [Oceanicola sp. 22II-s10i]|uniref:flavin-containing monooxygenase n=1 Tax=Oceanicola sp. 22II-s10i TaxID=1317116 RepID=UPI000B52844F|nr:NAD(P)/FAD-dependent oxidoreductase [Oceanicola sp. 22II-s10i]
MSDAEVIVVGAGPAGLACAAMLKARGLDPLVLERSNRVANSWRYHYDRLHLHTHRNRSGLPGLPMPQSYPKYPSRDQVIEYLETYAAHHGIAPRFDAPVTAIRREDDGWLVSGPSEPWRAPHVIIATGPTTQPFRASWPGMESFPGRIIHSSQYRNYEPFRNLRVLVVGFGNSGGEIAVDLSNGRIHTALSVRGPVNVVPKEIWGIPTTSLTFLQRILPPGLADALTGPVVRWHTGDIRKLGLTPKSKGPIRQVNEDGKVPLIDLGTLERLREKRLSLRPGIQKFDGWTISFADGRAEDYDAVILATGYRPDLRSLLPDAQDLLDAGGAPLASGADSGRDGLYFCSFRQSPYGQLYNMGREAEAIADRIADAPPPPPPVAPEAGSRAPTPQV